MCSGLAFFFIYLHLCCLPSLTLWVIQVKVSNTHAVNMVALWSWVNLYSRSISTCLTQAWFTRVQLWTRAGLFVVVLMIFWTSVFEMIFATTFALAHLFCTNAADMLLCWIFVWQGSQSKVRQSCCVWENLRQSREVPLSPSDPTSPQRDFSSHFFHFCTEKAESEPGKNEMYLQILGRLWNQSVPVLCACTFSEVFAVQSGVITHANQGGSFSPMGGIHIAVKQNESGAQANGISESEIWKQTPLRASGFKLWIMNVKHLKVSP